MVNNLQFLRSLNAGTSPVSLAAGQIAFNLPDKKLFVGDGTDTIKRLDGTTESVLLGEGYFESDLSLVSSSAYTDQKIAELVDSAPELLNTLNELAALALAVWALGFLLLAAYLASPPGSQRRVRCAFT
jgi:hypothetical protein